MKFRKDTIYKKKFRKYLIKLEGERYKLKQTQTNKNEVFNKTEFRNKLIDYASDTKENINCINNIGYNFNEGFFIIKKNKSLIKFIEELSEIDVYRSVKSYFYEISLDNDWNSIIYMIKYCLQNLGQEDSLVSLIDKHISNDYFQYSGSNKLRDAFYQFPSTKEFKSNTRFIEKDKFRNFEITRYQDLDSDNIRVGIGLKNKKILLSDIVYEIENIDYYKIKNRIGVQEEEWNAATRFLSLIFFSLER